MLVTGRNMLCARKWGKASGIGKEENVLAWHMEWIVSFRVASSFEMLMCNACERVGCQKTRQGEWNRKGEYAGMWHWGWDCILPCCHFFCKADMQCLKKEETSCVSENQAPRVKMNCILYRARLPGKKQDAKACSRPVQRW